jgi:hypothetical protein
MHSNNINNDNNKFSSNLDNVIENLNKEELLLQNREIINSLILENNQKKDKSFITTKELEFIKEYETNLLKLLENCPPGVLQSILQETSHLDPVVGADEIKENTEESEFS